MQKLKCELCGSIDIVKIENDLFQCTHCGCKYTKEQAKSLISGVVEVVKGAAELERRLKNAEIHMQLREHEKALLDLASLSDEYPAENIVYLKRLEYIYKTSERLTVSDFYGIAAIYRKAIATAKSKADQESITRKYHDFYIDFVKGLMAHQKTVDFIDFFREAFKIYKENKTKPESIFGHTLWNGIGTAVAAGIASGKILFEDSCTEKPSLFSNLYPQSSHVMGYADLDLIGELHPKLKAVIEKGRQNAWELNHAPMRLAYIHTYDDYKEGYGPAFRSLQSGYAEFEQLYVEVEFRLNDATFASYAVRRNGKTERFSHASIRYLEYRNKAFPSMQSLQLSFFSCCPFCGVRDWLRHGKCRCCHGKIPRAVIADMRRH